MDMRLNCHSVQGPGSTPDSMPHSYVPTVFSFTLSLCAEIFHTYVDTMMCQSMLLLTQLGEHVHLQCIISRTTSPTTYTGPALHKFFHQKKACSQPMSFKDSAWLVACLLFSSRLVVLRITGCIIVYDTLPWYSITQPFH